MDPAKVEFLFDRVSGIDLDDPDQRANMVVLDGNDALSDARSAMRAIVAEQIINDDPPAVWATAQRLRALGKDRSHVMAQLAMALSHAAQAALAGGDPDAGLDVDAYEAALGSLPLPTPAEIENAALAIVAGATPVPADDLDSGVLSLGHARGRPRAGPAHERRWPSRPAGRGPGGGRGHYDRRHRAHPSPHPWRARR